MRSCERPRKRSASEALPSSVSNRYFWSIRTHGSSCRRRASSSPRRVCSFSASSSSSRAASHSSCVPVLCAVIVISFSHRKGEPGHCRRRGDDQDAERDDRQGDRYVEGGPRGKQLLGESE